MTDSNARNKLSLNRDAKRGGLEVEERLHKVLAMAGIGSRRLLEERIVAGEIRINGSVAETGASLRAGDRVELDGKAFMAVASAPQDLHLAIYHKPEGEVTTHDDPEGRPTVFEKFPRLDGARWVSVGRLDINTTGLLLLTSDGELANAMMHPSSELEREYVCRVHGPVDEAVLERLRKGVELEDGPARFDEIAVINLGESHSWLRVVLREGRNREVRRLWESQGLEVSRLKRIRYGSVELPRELRRGRFETLPIERLVALRNELGLGPLPHTLTLQPVVGVRRAAKPNEFTPDNQRSPRAWTGNAAEEGRELRAFDHIREDAPRRGKRPLGKGRARPAHSAGPGRGPARDGQRQPWAGAGDAGRGRRPGGGPVGPGGPGRGRAGRGNAPGNHSAGDSSERGPAAGRDRRDNADQPPRDFDPNRAVRAGEGNRLPRGFDANRTPRRPAGGIRRGAGGGGGVGEADGNRPRRNPAERRSWPAGSTPARGPRAGTGLPQGYPSDHAYAQRQHGNVRDDLGNRKPDRPRTQSPSGANRPGGGPDRSRNKGRAKPSPPRDGNSA